LLDDPRYVLGEGADMRVSLGALFDALLIAANIGTAIVLYPIVKRQSESVALGYITARVMECAIIVVGIFSLHSVMTLRQEMASTAGADAASLLTTTGRALVAAHVWTRLFGPGLLAGVGDGMLLGYLMYRSGLVPRRMAMLGLIGGPMLVIAFVAVLLGAFEEGSPWQFALSLPEIAWEGSLGIYLAWKGFKATRIISP
jgi:hypothetical protein